MTTRRRAARAASGFDRTAYEAELAAFWTELGEALYAALAGFRDDPGTAQVYERHAALFEPAAIDGLRAGAEGDSDDARQARALLAFAVEGNLERRVAPLTDAIETAQAQAVIMWRGEAIPYRAAGVRAAAMTDRRERNAFDDSVAEAVEAINPLRSQRLEAMRSGMAELGYANEVELLRKLHGIDAEALGRDLRQFLLESETVYYAALRRYLAEIDIEQGDASSVDLSHLLRGGSWDAWFEPRRLMPVLRSTLGGLGIDLAGQSNVTLDIEARERKTPRAFAVAIRVPQDVRMVLQPRGGHDDFETALHELGHVEHRANTDASQPVAWRFLGDGSVTEGYAFLLQYLVMEPAWLAEHLGMDEREAVGWLDFAAFRKLVYLRRYAAKVLYELRLHRDDEIEIARSYYAGLLGLLVGVRQREERFLADLDDHFYAARYLRAWMLEGSLRASLAANHGAAWWREPAAGETLRRSWSVGQAWDADDVVAHLGYDHLDWRPVLRQIRTRLIGEMSGYGGPNITTRAGTRKV